MSFENAPSLDNFKNGLPENLPDPARRRAFVRVATAVFLVLVVGLLALRLQQAASGTVSGIVLDHEGKPVQAELSVAGANAFVVADENGFFTLTGVPAGAQSLVIGYQAVGREVQVQVRAGQTVDLGEFRFFFSDFQSGWAQPR
jgi:hypothetical protein